MLLGEFNHSIDEKGRLIIPAKLRDDLGENFVICNGLEGCLFVYSQEEWNKFVTELEALPRMSKDARIYKRYFFGSASEGTFDKQGRVLVPPPLRKTANLEKDVVLVGVQDHVEIWDKARWEDESIVSEGELDAIAERILGGI
ncbi:MAG: division/cell wall cluster transcriptional repressor MraZ [Ruminococcus sp.]|jgi:MraZ protein|nr:division/cell wall cluster transcriptional repressor MraZ [Ruminococcus sp.]